MKEWIKDNWIWALAAAIVVVLLIVVLFDFGGGKKKADRDKKLSYQSPYMKGPEICRLQEKLQDELGEKASDYLIFDCIYGPSTRDAMEKVYGKTSITLNEIGA